MTGNNDSSGWMWNWGVRLTVLAWYLWHMNPNCGFYDAIAFLWSAERGFDLNTNATSHFLYNNVQHLLVIAFPWIKPVTILGLFNITCSWVALVLFHHSLLKRFESWKAHVAMLALALSFTWWQQTETIEVYGMSNLLFMGYAIPALAWNLDKSRKYPGVLIHAWLGLALLTHIQHILALPMLFWQCWQLVKAGRSREIFPIMISTGMLAGLCALAWSMPGQTIMAVFTDRQFGDAVFAAGIKTVLSGAGKGLILLLYNIHFWMIGVVIAFRRLFVNGNWFVPLLLSCTFFGFAMRYEVADNHVFYLPVYATLLWLMPLGLPDRPAFARYAIVLPWVSLLLYLLVWFSALQFPYGKKLNQQKAYKGGIAYLIWPGKRNAPDPFVLADSLGRHPELLEGHEWQDGYVLANAYLEWKRNSDQNTMQ